MTSRAVSVAEKEIAVEPDLRGVMRYFATGVCILSTYLDGPDGRQHDALTVNSLSSVSLDPPLVSVCLREDCSMLGDLLATKAWALSILDVGGDDIARLFARGRESRRSTLRALATTPGEHTGALVLDSPGWLECALRDHLTVGDHTLLIGEVLAAGAADRRPPLIFLRGRYFALGESRPAAPCGEPGLSPATENPLEVS